MPIPERGILSVLMAVIIRCLCRQGISPDVSRIAPTWNNSTFASLGLTPGTYEWTWGTGDHRRQLHASNRTAGVPDGGSTLSLLGFASLGLVALRRKLRC